MKELEIPYIKGAKVHMNIYEGLHPGIYNDRKLGQAHLKMGQPILRWASPTSNDLHPGI